MTKPPTALLLTADAATYAGVKPATLRVWRHRYGLTPRWTRAGHALYDVAELAAIVAEREAKARPRTPTLLDVLDNA